MSDTGYLRFWGVRGSHVTPVRSHIKVGGNTSCVEIRVGDDTVLCDAGTGIIPFGHSAIEDPNHPRKLLIILTHYHWDHICGLPFFVPAFRKDWQLRFFGPGDSVSEIRQNVDSQMQPPYFPVGTESWMADISYVDPDNMSIDWGIFSISRFGVQHPGLTYGYRIKIRDQSVLYISDNECRYAPGQQQTWTGEGLVEEEQELLRKIEHEEYEIELGRIRDADILIHDAQYTPQTYTQKQGWGHSCYTDTVNVAIDAGVKVLYLYHHDPLSDDDDVEKIHQACLQLIKERGSAMRCHVAREGDMIDLFP